MIKHYVGLGIWKFLRSVLAALVGVQSQKQRQQDFAEDNLARIIAICFVGAAVLIFVVLVTVNMALPEGN